MNKQLLVILVLGLFVAEVTARNFFSGLYMELFHPEKLAEEAKNEPALQSAHSNGGAAHPIAHGRRRRDVSDDLKQLGKDLKDDSFDGFNKAVETVENSPDRAADKIGEGFEKLGEKIEDRK